MNLKSQSNRCFVCGPGNPDGLNVTFHIDDENVCRGECMLGANHVGYDGVAHGGLLFSLLDDVMANWLWLKGEKCFTARADVRYREPLPVSTPVRLEGRLLKRKGRLAVLEGRVIRADTDGVVAEAQGRFMVGV